MTSEQRRRSDYRSARMAEIDGQVKEEQLDDARTEWPTINRHLASKGDALGLSSQTIDHLGRSYAAEARTILDLVVSDASLGQLLIDDLPYIRAEVVYGCRQEMAMTPDDVLARRTAIMLEDRQRGVGIVNEVAALMAQEQNWSSQQQQALVEAYRSSIQEQLAAAQLAL